MLDGNAFLKFCVSLEQGLNLRSQGKRGHLRVKEGHILAVRSYKVLAEVPGRLLTSSFAKELEDRMCLATSHHTLLKHIKLNLVACSEGSDVINIPRLLSSKTVAGEGKNRKLGRAEPFVQLVQFLVVSICVTSLRSDVYNQRHLSSVLIKFHRGPIQLVCREFEEFTHYF